MSKLYLENIYKTYQSSEIVHALKRVTLSFDTCEFVSIIGPSGCGKTTLLNTIGGLDHYDDGDFFVDGESTKDYVDADWDVYRNRSIGFVFQHYNLIGHLSVLQNVMLALSFSDINAEARKNRAKEALQKVGLLNVRNKKPNQLSGGQAQRVAIARALVNDPDVILADEPTGALDSGTGLRIMEILKEVSKTKLVIMVTHNQEMAKTYSTRIIKMLDGEVVSDSRLTAETVPDTLNKRKHKKYAMLPGTAFTLSLQNLLTKKSRTFFTALAGGIGIIGVALVLALSGGLSDYMTGMQSDALSGYPITIVTTEETIDGGNRIEYERYPGTDVMYRDDESEYMVPHTNILSQEYLDYIGDMDNVLPGSANAIMYSRGVYMNLINLVSGESEAPNPFLTTGMEEEVGTMGMSSTYLQVMPENEDFILSQYELIGKGSRLPEKEDEIVLVVDEYNQMDVDFFNKLGIHNGINEYKLTDFIGKSIAKVIPNDTFYIEKDGLYPVAASDDYNRLLKSKDGIYLTVTGILRIKPSASGAYFKEGAVCTQALLDWGIETAVSSKVAAAQAAVDYDVHTGLSFQDTEMKEKQMRRLGADPIPTAIDIYPKDFAATDAIADYLDAWNAKNGEEGKIAYNNNATTLTTVTGSLISTVYHSLILFACISLLVSGLMIAIITYISVVERTKEIGILRSIGARKKDITYVFEAETLIIGFLAGMIGVVISILITIPINSVILQTTGVAGIASINLIQVVFLLLGSMVLTFISGFIPAKLAAKKDPVAALRAE